MLYFLLFLSVLMETLKNVYNNIFGKNLLKTTEDSVLFQIVGGIGAMLFCLITAGQIRISTFSMLLAVVFAAITAAANYCSLMAVATGPMSASTLFVYMGMVIPTAFGILYYRQPVSFFQVVGCVLMIASLFLCIQLKRDSSMTVKWLIYAMGSFVMWGAVGICQQLHQESAYAHELNGFLFWSFAILTIFMFIIYIAIKKKITVPCGYRLKSKATVYVLITGIFIGIVYKINLFLTGALPSIIFFPVVNGGVMLLSEISAITAFKEKATVRQLVGILVGILSVCMLGI